jgi:hypothetical protein
MTSAVSACQGCGHPMTIGSGQYLLACRYCGKRFIYANPVPPAIALQPRITASDARSIMIKELRHKEIDAAFRVSSFFEKATLYFIPFHEVRGVRAGKVTRENAAVAAAPDATGFLIRFQANPDPTTAASGRPRCDYVCNSFTYLERANDCGDLEIGFIDLMQIEECLLSAVQIPFQPAELRRLGVVLPVEKCQNISSGLEPFALPMVEHGIRLIYVPVWEIAYSLNGILFKSYLDAICGRLIRLHALRSRSRNIVRAMLGTSAAAIALARTAKLSLAVPLFSSIFTLLFLGVLGATLLLLPYFWQIFSCREMLVVSPGCIDSVPIEKADSFMVRMAQRATDGLLRFFNPPRAS